PPERILPEVSSAGSRSRSETTTAAPSAAKRSAVAAPIPRAPPVTRATFPSNLIRSPPLNSPVSGAHEFEQTAALVLRGDSVGLRRGREGLDPKGHAATVACPLPDARHEAGQQQRRTADAHGPAPVGDHPGPIGVGEEPGVGG